MPPGNPPTTPPKGNRFESLQEDSPSSAPNAEPVPVELKVTPTPPHEAELSIRMDRMEEMLKLLLQETRSSKDGSYCSYESCSRRHSVNC